MTAYQLTPVETRMLTLLAEGRTHDAIGREIGRSGRSTAVALSRLYRQIGAINAASAVAIAVRAGLIKVEVSQ